MNYENCNHGHDAPVDLLSHLHPSQAGAGRHKCPVCAFHEGKSNASKYRASKIEACKNGKTAPIDMLASLPDSQGGSGRHRCCVCAYDAGVKYGSALQDARDDIETEQRTEENAAFEGGSEGSKKTRTISQYERDPANRAEALRLHGKTCAACGFNFDAYYGADVARGYIEIHHLIMVSQLKGKKVNPKTDMVPLCSNCHSIAHRTAKKLLSIDEIKAAISKQKKKP